MSIVTRQGDEGMTTVMFGRVLPKNHPRLRALGTIDELTAALGMARVGLSDRERGEFLQQVQHDLVLLMGALSVLASDAGKKLPFRLPDESMLGRLDQRANRTESQLPKADGWDYPGVNEAQARLHVARAVCRRAEREVWNVVAAEPGFDTLPARYLNRLADVLWLFARDAGAPNPFITR